VRRLGHNLEKSLKAGAEHDQRPECVEDRIDLEPLVLAAVAAAEGDELEAELVELLVEGEGGEVLLEPCVRAAGR
jgi:hypothetical protein